MRLKILSLILISTCTIASEIEELSNISTEQSETILVTSKFHGYKLDDNSKFRYVNSVDLDGLDWAFWYGENRSHSKPNSNLISDVKTFGEFKFHHQKPASGNEYFGAMVATEIFWTNQIMQSALSLEVVLSSS